MNYSQNNDNNVSFLQEKLRVFKETIYQRLKSVKFNVYMHTLLDWLDFSYVDEVQDCSNGVIKFSQQSQYIDLYQGINNKKTIINNCHL